MAFWSNTRRVQALMREDMDAHIGDIAVLKVDSIGLDAAPHLRDQLAPVRGPRRPVQEPRRPAPDR